MTYSNTSVSLSVSFGVSLLVIFQFHAFAQVQAETQAYGSLAISTDSGSRYGWSIDQKSAEQANDAALVQCATEVYNCKTVLTFTDACAAYAVDDSEKINGWGTAETLSIAIEIAVTEAVARGARAPKLRVWGCTSARDEPTTYMPPSFTSIAEDFLANTPSYSAANSLNANAEGTLNATEEPSARENKISEFNQLVSTVHNERAYSSKERALEVLNQRVTKAFNKSCIDRFGVPADRKSIRYQTWLAGHTAGQPIEHMVHAGSITGYCGETKVTSSDYNDALGDANKAANKRKTHQQLGQPSTPKANQTILIGNTFRFSKRYTELNHVEYYFFQKGFVAKMTWYETAGPDPISNPILSIQSWKRVSDDEAIIQSSGVDGRQFKGGERHTIMNQYFKITQEGLTPIRAEVANRSNGTVVWTKPEENTIVFKQASPMGPDKFRKYRPGDRYLDIDEAIQLLKGTDASWVD